MRARAWCAALLAVTSGCAWDWDRLEPPRDAVASDASDASAPDDTAVAPDVAACPGGMTRCGDRCVDTQNDIANCGGCGQRCRRFGMCSNGSCR